ncbi:hypothetical protein PIB30_056230 [Stylosanthes scabra]|uniref:Uncharacterized protein n=1 Tax=Stylosanthes scabra TaxID=79078 RepID=A0ABU6SJN0_9FABA|nr:hypothetical protein [Stylosanthes scabra]
MKDLSYSDDEDSAKRIALVSIKKKVVGGFSRNFWKEQSVLGVGDLNPFKEGVVGGRFREENRVYKAVENLTPLELELELCFSSVIF